MNDLAFLSTIVGPLKSDGALVEAVERGFDVAAIDRLTAIGWTTADIRLVLSPTCVRRRRQSGRLNAEESDRLARLLRIQAHAERVFHGREKARQWLRLELWSLGGRTPFSVARYGVGALLVENILSGIAWGAVA